MLHILLLIPQVAARLVELTRLHAQGQLTRDALQAHIGEVLGLSFGPGTGEPLNPVQMLGDIAVIDMVGLLSKSRPWWSDRATLPELADAILRAGADTKVKGIVLRIDSPGGTVSGTPEAARAIAQARTRKPVIAYAPDLVASGAYWLAAQADQLIIGDVAKVGSIGAYMVVDDWSAYFEKAGVKVHVIRDGAFKGAGEFGTAITDAQIADWQRLVNDQTDRFVQAIADGPRPLDRAAVLRLKDGRVHVGQKAVDLQLADRVGTFDDALAAAAAGSGRSGSGGDRS